MSISYPLDLPLGRNFRQIKVKGAVVAARNTSPFSQKEQVTVYDGDRWAWEISFPSLAVADAKNVIGWLASLRGPVGTFYIRDPFASPPIGVATGTPLVNGAPQTGLSVVTDGWSISVTGILKRGDMVGIGTGLHVVTKDANSNGSGQSTLDIWPGLRGTISDNAPINVSTAVATARLEDSGFDYLVNTDGTYDISFSAVEAL